MSGYSLDSVHHVVYYMVILPCKISHYGECSFENQERTVTLHKNSGGRVFPRRARTSIKSVGITKSLINVKKL